MPAETDRHERTLMSWPTVPMADIGLWGDKVQKAYADMGVLDMAGIDLNALMKQDEDIAEQIDVEKAELAASARVVEATVELGRTV